ncbi:class I SAM-dependent methyltransferase [Thiocystis violacea]|uniref:class I SAM-dependent methyltransferase n=1 Tax=Thiocystis violacea TaxID=13725 RepID=UPI0019050D29|nr:class I SAM-dependent methyltransferase [Thiocystis violacea]MBK1724340.1 hypothetical protein [Thiocystis violacea]
MPFSNVEQITPIMQEVLRIRPEKMLDVGCGFGVYGMLSRIQLDLYSDETFYTKVFRAHRSSKRWAGTRIDAIEGFEDYLDYIPDWVYDDIRVEDVRTALPTIPDEHYDLCLALAIIEHLTKEEGLEFIRQLKRIGKAVVIAVPKRVDSQEVPNNPFETHRSAWQREDFVALGANAFLPHSAAWIAVFDASRPRGATAEPTPAAPSTELELARIENKLDTLLERQTQVLSALSIKHRIGSLWGRMSRATR